jgi:glycosyltransferase involved in cell wall biosynthesis
MRLLFISLDLPLPANNGHRMRIWALLRALAAEGHETDLLTFGDPGAMELNNRQLREVCRGVDVVRLERVNWSENGNYFYRLRAAFSATPFGVRRFKSKEMRARLVGKLQTRDFDAVLSETPYPLINFPSLVPIPLIFDDQNVEHVLIKRYLTREQNAAKRAYARLEWRKLRKWERAVCSRASLVMVCSEHDRSQIKELCPDRSVAVVPNIIDVDAYSLSPRGDAFTVLYLGGLDWHPNRDAVEFFASAILPGLARLIPGVKFVAAFSPDHAPPVEFRQRLAKIPQLHFAQMQDARAEIAKASVFVVPIQIGSGTRFKILEAAAMGKPIVSTTVGAEGLGFVNQDEILLADKPEVFARSVASLLTNESRRIALGQAARRRVEQQYSFPVLREAVREALSELARKPPGFLGTARRHFQMTQEVAQK